MAEPQQRPEPRKFIDAAGRRRKRAPLHGRFVEKRTPNTLRGYQATVRAALTDARRFGLYTGENPAQGTMPAIGEAKAAKIEKIDFTVPLSQRIRLDKWKPSETARFLNHIAGHRLAVLWKLYATIGTRRGELAGAGWFSYEGNIIAIESRLLKLSGPQRCDFCPVEHIGVLWQPGAKSGNGVRTIFLPDQLVTAIADHRIAQAAERDARVAAGLPWWEHQLMFCEPDGTPLYPDDITDEFNRLVADCGLPKIRLHDLRHNVASLLLATGMPFASVMKITGHDEDTLKKIYHHVVGEIVTPEMQAAYDWMEALQASEQAKAVARVAEHGDTGASVTSMQGRRIAAS
jgi:integrase